MFQTAFLKVLNPTPSNLIRADSFVVVARLAVQGLHDFIWPVQGSRLSASSLCLVGLFGL